MKNILSLLYLLLALAAQPVVAQNLVPDGSFEDTLRCPSWNDIECMKYWWSTSGASPDFFNTCAGVINYNGIPDNAFGRQLPKSGNGYAGMSLFHAQSPNDREYLQTKLKTPLLANKTYYVSGYICISNYFYLTIDRFGFYLSLDSVHLPFLDNSVINRIPQVSNPSDIFPNDTLNWMQISGSFVAQGGEQFLTIGNFYNDSNTLTKPSVAYGDSLNRYSNAAYFYLDDICISENADECKVSVGIKPVYSIQKPIIQVLNKSLFISLTEPAQIEIFTFTGNKILETYSIDFQKKIELASLSSGLYILHIRTKEQIFIHKIFINP